MTREERELSITYLEEIKEGYIEGEEYERHPLPEYYAIETAIKALEQEPILDKIKEIVNEWQSDTWADNLSYECMVKIAELVEPQESEVKE